MVGAVARLYSMTTYTLTVRVAEGREHDIDEYLHEVAAHLVGERVAWTLTQQHDNWSLTHQNDARPDHAATRRPKLALVGA